MRIGLDMDGVIADFNTGWTERYNRDFGARLSVDQLVTWDCLVDNTHFTTYEEFWEWIQSKHPGFFATLPSLPDGMGLVNALKSAGHQICIISDKPAWARADTLFWLGAHGVPAKEVYFTRDKYKIPCGAYIDDSDEQVGNYVQYRPAAKIFHYARPWNNFTPGTIRVESWEEIMEKL